MNLIAPDSRPTRPLLLFDGECSVCRRIGHWVQKSAKNELGVPSIVARPIGDDPAFLRSLNPGLDIWDAYSTIHVVMPDGSMKLGGEAVAEVLREMPKTRWIAWSFNVGVFGFRPFQMLLNLAYVILSNIRPLFGCESCGTPNLFVKSVLWPVQMWRSVFAKGKTPSQTPHFTSSAAKARSPRSV